MDANDAKFNTLQKVVYPEFSYVLVGLFMETQRKHGRFAKEKQYGDYFESLLIREGIAYVRELPLNKLTNDPVFKSNRIDFIANNKILIEMKVVPFLGKGDYYQTMRYLQAANLKLGLLVNFRSEYLKPKRILNSLHHS